jgi:carbamoyl-phosphate synthase large subunit
MEKKTVLVTGIGGNVGQGIVRNILGLKYGLRIIGTNTSAISGGNHLVDAFYQVPYSYDEDFIPSLIAILEKEKVDLIIPSTDFEINTLSLNKDQIKAVIACSGKQSSSIYLDKYLSALFHAEHRIPFAESCLPSSYSGQFSPAIAKPRLGRGSRGLIKNYSGEEKLNDEEYLIQKMYTGKEITTAVYVSYITGKLLGLITMERSLENGATTYCKVIREYDDQLEEIALEIIRNSDIKGSFNIQSIVTDENEIYPFEVNCRISGTNSIRSHFGFEDVKYTVDELLYKKSLREIVTTEGVAYRYLSDIIYPNGINTGTNSDDFIVF